MQGPIRKAVVKRLDVVMPAFDRKGVCDTPVGAFYGLELSGIGFANNKKDLGNN